MSKTLFSGLFMALQATVAAAAPPPPELRAALDVYRVPDEHVGLYVAPLDGGEEAVSLNPSKPFNPASVIKLLPSLAALETLTPAYQWSTRVYTTGPTSGGTLNGDLYIQGGGDPYLTVNALWALLKRVRALGIERIAGDIVVDDGVFGLSAFDPAAFDDRPYRIYNGPAGGLMVNFWALRFTITALSNKVHIDVFPDSRRIKVVNRVKHSSSRCTGSTRYIRYDVEQGRDAVTLTFDGVLSEQCSPVIMSRAVVPAEHYAEYVLPDLWRDVGGSLEGGVRKGSVPDNARIIYRHLSRSLAEVVHATNKFSNNMMARHLLLTLGTVRKERDIRLEDGLRVLAEWILSKDLEVPGLNIVNGSGLSRDTRVSPLGMANVLRAGFHSRYAPEFLASLPIAGEDPALDSRQFQGGGYGMVRIKTGLIDHVRAMAGYVTSRRGRNYVVVLLINHEGVHRGVGTRMQNAVLRYVLDL